MDAAWKRWVELGVLWGSPVVITLAAVAVGWWLQTVRANFGAMRSTAELTVLAGAIALALHAGYFLAPFAQSRGGELLAVGLMAPGALAALLMAGMVVASGAAADLGVRPGGAVVMAAAAVVGLVVYAGPAVVVLLR